MNREYFTVELASQIVLGLSLTEMATVVQFETKYICAVPGVAEFWHGVVNFKGSLLWVLDSDRFLNGANAPASRRDFEAGASVSLMGETTPVPITGGTPATDWLPKTALHRFLNLPDKNKTSPQKLTAIIIQDRQKQVALVTRQLKGIVAVEPSELKSLANDNTSQLHQCCSAIAQTAAGVFYTLDSAALLQQLHQGSSLVSV